MIEVTLKELGLWVMTLLFITLGMLALISRMRDRRHLRRRRREIMCCDVCGNVFEDLSGERIVACDQCGRDTLRGRDRSLG